MNSVKDNDIYAHCQPFGERSVKVD